MPSYHRRTLRPSEAQDRLRRFEELFPAWSRTSGNRSVAENADVGGHVASKHLRRADRRKEDGGLLKLATCPFNPEGTAEAQDYVHSLGTKVTQEERERAQLWAAVLGFWSTYKSATGCLHLQWRAVGES